VSADASQSGEQVGSAELVAALCLATDLGMGFPFEHGLRSPIAGWWLLVRGAVSLLRAIARPR
jgi:hypothetical protein